MYVSQASNSYIMKSENIHTIKNTNHFFVLLQAADPLPQLDGDFYLAVQDWNRKPDEEVNINIDTGLSG